MTTSAAIDTAAVRDIAETEQSQLAAGVNAVRVRAEGPGAAIDSEACIALGETRGVIESGPIWRLGTGRLSSAPDRPVVLVTGTASAAAALSRDPSLTDGMWVVATPELADFFGIRSTSNVRVADDTGRESLLRLSAIADLGLRDPSLDTALFVVGAGTGPPDQCVIEFAAWVSAPARAGADSFVSSGLDGLSTAQVVPPNSLLVDPLEALQDRLTRLAWIVAGFVAGVAAFFLRRSRRNEVALYRSFGTGRVGAYLVVLSESAVICGLALALSFALCTAAYWPDATLMRFAWRQIAMAGALAQIAMSIVGSFGLRIAPATLFKE